MHPLAQKAGYATLYIIYVLIYTFPYDYNFLACSDMQKNGLSLFRILHDQPSHSNRESATVHVHINKL